MARLADQAISILTFHSISDGEGATNIPPDVFRMQIESIAELGVEVVGLAEVKNWLAGRHEIEKPTIVITFDDAFSDFAETAFPILNRCGFKPCVFAPTGLVGGVETWAPPGAPQRKLMDWATLKDLSRQGVDFQSHACSHQKLTALGDDELENELVASRKTLEDRLSCEVSFFAPPYGDSNARVRDAIARHYDLSLGVNLNKARRTAPKYDLPRIDMHYFRDRPLWRSFLKGKGDAYLNLRRTLRGARQVMENVSMRKGAGA
ncbi:MAG: polysaccharide deacetylase family protein [Parvularculaceae bacterium]